MTDAEARDRSRQYLVPVGSYPDQPQDTHLAVTSWYDRANAWAHSYALCGLTVPQGELSGDTTVTCQECLAKRQAIEEALAKHAKPSAEALLRVELRVATKHAHEADAARADAEAELLSARAELARARAREARTLAAAVTDRAALEEVRRLCRLTIEASARVQARAQAQDTLAAIERVTGGEPATADGAWGTVWLESKWRWITSRMTTEQREYAADCVARWSAALHPDDPAESEGLRWWRD